MVVVVVFKSEFIWFDMGRQYIIALWASSSVWLPKNSGDILDDFILCSAGVHIEYGDKLTMAGFAADHFNFGGRNAQNGSKEGNKRRIQFFIIRSGGEADFDRAIAHHFSDFIASGAGDNSDGNRCAFPTTMKIVCGHKIPQL